LNRSRGDGIFSTTAADPADHSFKDVCYGIRQQREEVIQPLALVAGLALIVSSGWVVFVAAERRNVPT
jgi:hypothetical protein